MLATMRLSISAAVVVCFIGTLLLTGCRFHSGSPATNKESRGCRLQRLEQRRKIGLATLAQMPNCPQCGEPSDSGDPAGLCPKCLILGAFESSTGADESRTQTTGTATAAAYDDDFGRYQIVR